MGSLVAVSFLFIWEKGVDGLMDFQGSKDFNLSGSWPALDVGGAGEHDKSGILYDMIHNPHTRGAGLG